MLILWKIQCHKTEWQHSTLWWYTQALCTITHLYSCYYRRYSIGYDLIFTFFDVYDQMIYHANTFNMEMGQISKKMKNHLQIHFTHGNDLNISLHFVCFPHYTFLLLCFFASSIEYVVRKYSQFFFFIIDMEYHYSSQLTHDCCMRHVYQYNYYQKINRYFSIIT